jgi:hypothetical protein
MSEKAKIFVVFLWVLCLSAMQAIGAETAITTSGKKVLLKNDGTWEPFDPARHLNVEDVREQANMVEISLKYKDAGWCQKETRMMLEADDIAEPAILDSLKKAPQGGLIYVQMPSQRRSKTDPRTYLYTVKDSKSKVLVQREASEALAVDADEANTSNLAILPLPAFAKGDLTIIIQDKGTKQIFEYTISMDEE